MMEKYLNVIKKNEIDMDGLKNLLFETDVNKYNMFFAFEYFKKPALESIINGQNSWPGMNPLSEEDKKKPDIKAQRVIDIEKKKNEYLGYLLKYEEFLKKEEIKPSLFKMQEPKDKMITAWYTPEIPVSFGPNNYWGLPGLILEINEPELIILCSKVVLNTKGATIKAPNKGKKVSQKEFDTIQKKKYDSMKNDDGVIIFQTTH